MCLITVFNYIFIYVTRIWQQSVTKNVIQNDRFTYVHNLFVLLLLLSCNKKSIFSGVMNCSRRAQSHLLDLHFLLRISRLYKQKYRSCYSIKLYQQSPTIWCEFFYFHRIHTGSSMIHPHFFFFMYLCVYICVKAPIYRWTIYRNRISIVEIKKKCFPPACIKYFPFLFERAITLNLSSLYMNLYVGWCIGIYVVI